MTFSLIYVDHIAKQISLVLLLSCDKPFVGMCFVIFEVSFGQNFKNHDFISPDVT